MSSARGKVTSHQHGGAGECSWAGGGAGQGLGLAASFTADPNLCVALYGPIQRLSPLCWLNSFYSYQRGSHTVTSLEQQRWSWLLTLTYILFQIMDSQMSV